MKFILFVISFALYVVCIPEEAAEGADAAEGEGEGEGEKDAKDDKAGDKSGKTDGVAVVCGNPCVTEGDDPEGADKLGGPNGGAGGPPPKQQVECIPGTGDSKKAEEGDKKAEDKKPEMAAGESKLRKSKATEDTEKVDKKEKKEKKGKGKKKADSKSKKPKKEDAEEK